MRRLEETVKYCTECPYVGQADRKVTCWHPDFDDNPLIVDNGSGEEKLLVAIPDWCPLPELLDNKLEEVVMYAVKQTHYGGVNGGLSAGECQQVHDAILIKSGLAKT